MAGAPPQYSDAQRAAVAAAKLGDNGERMSARLVSEAAARGELGVPAFTVPISTVYRIADEVGRDRDHERLSKEVEADPTGTVRHWATRVLAASKTNLEEACDPDLDAVEGERRRREASKTLRELLRLFKAIDGPAPRSCTCEDDDELDGPETPETIDIARLLDAGTPSSDG